MKPADELRRRVGDTPLVRAPHLAEATGLTNLRLKLEGANPTGTQKDRIAHLEVQEAVAQGATGISVASCGNFGVAVAHASNAHDVPCAIFVPADFQGERVAIMEELGAKVHRAEGMYEDAVVASTRYAEEEGWFDANPGGANTIRALTGYAVIAQEIGRKINPLAVGVPIGNGSTLAGVHMGFRIQMTTGTSLRPKMMGGTSLGNNPVPLAVQRNQRRCTPLEPRAVVETAVNEPLVNWDALDGTAALSSIQDSQGQAYGFEDAELLRLHQALLLDGIDAHPASLAAVAALAEGVKDGMYPADAPLVAVLTSGRPTIEVVDAGAEILDDVLAWLGKYRDPREEAQEALNAALDGGFVLAARDAEGPIGYCILTPMELDTFFPKYHLSYVAVSPEGRGRGVGSILLEEAIRRTDGNLSLHVDTDNQSAIRLYEKFGFHGKYLRMLYKGAVAEVDPATGSGWSSE